MTMTTQITSTEALLDLWAETPVGQKRGANIAVSKDLGVKATTVRSMRHRKSVNQKYWSSILEAAKRHAASGVPGFNTVNADLLVRIATVARSDNASRDGSAQGLVAA